MQETKSNTKYLDDFITGDLQMWDLGEHTEKHNHNSVHEIMRIDIFGSWASVGFFS